jgi:hypothetical protein
MDAYLAEALLWVKFLIGISAWVDRDNRSLKFEFNWLKILPNFITIKVIYPNFHSLILMFKRRHFNINFIELLSHLNKNIVPHELGKLDGDVSGVDESNLSFLPIGHVLIIV